MAEQVYPKGLRVWPPREGAPNFVKGKISIHLETFTEWAQQHLDEKGFIAFDLKDGRDGIYASLNQWKKPTTEAPDKYAGQRNDPQPQPQPKDEDAPDEKDILDSIPFN